MDMLELERQKHLYEKVAELGERDLELALIAYLRYSLGRRTYIVSSCVNYFTQLWPYLSDKLKGSVKHELDMYAYDVDNGLSSWGDRCDEEMWKKLIDLTKEVSL